MIDVTLDEKYSLAILEPHEALSEDDFKYASTIIDPFIKKQGHLKGIIIYVESFPGWDSFSGLISHLKFINEHHKKVSYVLFVTDSILIDIVEPITKHFVSAKVKTFPFNELESAKKWIQEH
jgi:hypothetical protein